MELITVEEAGEILKCSPEAVRQRIRRGQLKAYRLWPRATRLRRDELLAFVEKSAVGENTEGEK